MGILDALNRAFERRMFGGTMEDYRASEASTAADYDLPHDDLGLEGRLPRSALGEPLVTWSVRRTRSQVSKSTWFHETSDRELLGRMLEASGREWVDLSMASTCRIWPTTPLDGIQATRIAGADEASLRRAAEVTRAHSPTDRTEALLRENGAGADFTRQVGSPHAVVPHRRAHHRLVAAVQLCAC